MNIKTPRPAWIINSALILLLIQSLLHAAIIIYLLNK